MSITTMVGPVIDCYLGPHKRPCQMVSRSIQQLYCTA